MQEDNNEFGMTQEDIQTYNKNTFFAKVKYYLEIIEPTVIKIFNAAFYYTVRFIKTFVTELVRMAMGKEV